MIQRCHNPANKGYRLYGAKGITVCDRWRQSFDAFAADMGIPSPGLSLERQDNHSGYSPENCKWETRTMQNRNRSWCRYVTVNSERVTLKEAWQRYADPSVTYRSFVKRVVTRGWSIDQAISTPRQKVAA